MMRRFTMVSLCALSALGVASCQSEPTSPQSSWLRLNLEHNPSSLDPRQARDLIDHSLAKMLGEGLTRLTPDHTPSLASAEAVSISDDGLTYTFTLRPTSWSDGARVTSYDFLASWLTTLSPNFPTTNASCLYPIRGAQAAKMGESPLEAVGLFTPDTDTLVVTLEAPTPYFLELVSLPMFFPIPSHLKDTDVQVFNGPFCLKEWSHDHLLTVTRNEKYWDKEHVDLDGIWMSMVPDANTELHLFLAGELDWAGSPLSSLPADAISSLIAKYDVHAVPYAGTFWFKCNVTHPPLNDVRVRKALSYALDRQLLVDSLLSGMRIAAIGALPPTMALASSSYLPIHSTPSKAQALFEEALLDMHLSKEDLAPITLLYRAGDFSSKLAQAAQQQWKEALGLHIQLQAVEWKTMLDKMSSGDYDLGGKTWIADFNDPINFLGLYRDANGGLNETRWENVAYTQLLSASDQEHDATARKALLRDAEQILMEEMPIIPVYHPTYLYLSNPAVSGVYISPLGTLDLKWAKKE